MAPCSCCVRGAALAEGPGELPVRPPRAAWVVSYHCLLNSIQMLPPSSLRPTSSFWPATLAFRVRSAFCGSLLMAPVAVTLMGPESRALVVASGAFEASPLTVADRSSAKEALLTEPRVAVPLAAICWAVRLALPVAELLGVLLDELEPPQPAASAAAAASAATNIRSHLRIETPFLAHARLVCPPARRTCRRPSPDDRPAKRRRRAAAVTRATSPAATLLWRPHRSDASGPELLRGAARACWSRMRSARSTAGISVSWTKTGTGGSLSPASSATNANGVATTTLTTANVAGRTYTVKATSSSGDTKTGTSPTITTQ